MVKDEDKVEYAIAGDRDIEVVPTGPEEVELEFTGTLARDETSDVLTTIPVGATDLSIDLTATADLDLNLYDGTTFVIGWKAQIDSKGSTTGTYDSDTFAYSGWDSDEEYISSDGPLSRAYDLKVYGFVAGDYTVTVSYIPAGPDVTPPEITITAPDATVGMPTTIEVSASDPSGVARVEFTVSDSNGDSVASLTSFAGEGSVTFTPGEAGTYTVKAKAVDNQHNTSVVWAATFVVS